MSGPEQIRFSSEDNNLSFSVDARLMGELGVKLVTNNYLALVELIKNAYDADSTRVEVNFNHILSDVEEQKASIVIRDYGQGMTYAEVKKYWMRVSTAHKENSPYSKKYFRPVTGNKGIGRFACQRLAKRMVLRAISEPNKRGFHEVTKAIFNWSKFTSDLELNEITCKVFRYEKKGLEKGVTLKLKGLNEKWQQYQVNLVQRRLVSLSLAYPKIRKIILLPEPGENEEKCIGEIDLNEVDVDRLVVSEHSSGQTDNNSAKSNNELEVEDPGFEILINASHLDKQFVLGEKVLQAGWCSLYANVKDDGEVEIDFHAKQLGTLDRIALKKFPELNGSEIDIHFFPEAPEAFRNSALINKDQLRNMTENDSGIKVFSEGFRVYPYGEPQNDWLSLDADVARRKAKIDNLELKDLAISYGLTPARTMLSLPRNRGLYGSIKLKANRDSNFDIKLNREGFVENEASRQLTELARYLVDFIAVHYEKYKRFKTKQELDKTREKLKEKDKKLSDDSESLAFVSSAVKSIKEYIGHSKSSDVEDAEPQEVYDATEAIVNEFRIQESELTMLRYIASSAPLLFVFAHEMRNLLSELDTNAGLLENFAESIQSAESNRIFQMAQNLRHSKRRFLSVEKLISVFSSSHVVDHKVMLIESIILDVKNGFEFVANEHNIDITYEVSTKLLKTRKMAESAIYSVFVNIISNAIKAVLASDSDEKSIHIRAFRKGGLIIQVMDNGIGLSKKNWEVVFKPLTSDPSGELYRKLNKVLPGDSLDVLGRGSGLGLNIVKSIVKSNKGDVEFQDPEQNWETMIEVRLP